MISEIFITPQVFCGKGKEGMERLQDLKEILFPRSGDSPIVVSDLERADWLGETSRLLQLNADHNVRMLAQSLFSRIVDLMTVKRGSECKLKPKTECDWLTTASFTSQQYIIQLAVASNANNVKPNCQLNIITDFKSIDLDDCAMNPRPVDRTTEAQNPILLTLCGHAKWMIIQFPFLRGSNDEFVTLKQIIRLAEARPPCLGNCDVQIQLNPRDFENVSATIRTLIERLRTKKTNVVVCDAPNSFTDRTILAGDYETICGKPTKVARWKIQPGHPAVDMNLDSRVNNATPWSFFGRTNASATLKQIGADLKA